MATERLNDVWLVGTTWCQGCREPLLRDNCFCKAMAVSQAFIFHFKCYSILHFAVYQLLCWAFLLNTALNNLVHRQWKESLLICYSLCFHCLFVFLELMFLSWMLFYLGLMNIDFYKFIILCQTGKYEKLVNELILESSDSFYSFEGDLLSCRMNIYYVSLRH